MSVVAELETVLEGRYEIVRELGRGGMAVVHLARDLKHDRLVAIKVLPPELASTIGAERFVREIRTAARLSHPNILPLHDSIAVGAVRAYVMPYVEGESLRQRLDRERQLGLEQAVDIVRQVAAGLDYAHAHGIVHRDIKPENILLVGDQAMIADFGLARAVYSASSAPSTQSGIAVGTPAYMSPEQGAADRSVDGRTDVYALACVFFEMMAGMPPFRGATPGALLAAHATRLPPSLCAERASCPPEVAAVVERALAKVPADRYRTAGEFARALEWRQARGVTQVSNGRAKGGVPWLVGAAILAPLLIVATVRVAPRVAERVTLERITPDSSRIVVLPPGGTGGQRLTASVAHQRLTSALMEWRDLHVVEPPGIDAATSDDRFDARRAARRGKAAHVLVSTLAPIGDSVELRLALHDAGGERVRQQTMRVADDTHIGAERYRQIVASLLRTSDGTSDADDANPGTTRVAAWRAFTRGDSLRRAWSLDAAEREFRRAIAVDPTFARAHLWLAQVEQWQRPERTEWGSEAGKAAARIADLSRRDSLLAVGLTALSSLHHPDACVAYRALHALMPGSDLPWYGLAYCAGFDPIVVSSPGSPSGWRFRGSTRAAANAVDSALAHADGAPAFAFRMLDGFLITEPTRLRIGRGVAGELYYAFPTLIDDSLAFVPYPAALVERDSRGIRNNLSIALQTNIQRLGLAYREWIRRAPESDDAWSHLAHIQELQGDPAALVTIRQAVSRATPDSRFQPTITEIRLLVKQQQFDDARLLADSLLRDVGRLDAAKAQLLAGVAALVGKVPQAAELLAAAAKADPQAVFPSRYAPPAILIDAAASLLVSASAGACDDKIDGKIAELDRLLARYAASDQRQELRRSLLSRTVSLAVPCVGAGITLGFPATDPLLRMQRYFQQGRKSAVRAEFETLRRARLGMRPGDVALDHTFQEAWLLVAINDTVAAVSYLDLPLTALPTLSSHLLEDVPAAAALGRAFALRAELAHAKGDHIVAQRNARSVAALWTSASSSLQPVVSRMMAMSGSNTARARPR